MAEFDIKTTSETFADFISGYIYQFGQILTKPRSTLLTEFSGDLQGKKKIQPAIIYASSSILVGIILAQFIGLPKSPIEVNPQTAIAVLFIWILSAALLHPILKLFRAKGNLQDTIVVFLYIISTLHLLFIPVLTVLSRTITETQVTLTYEYVVYFGIPGREGQEEWAHVSSIDKELIELNSDPYWRSPFKGRYTETFVKEREPERDKTILPPVQEIGTNAQVKDIPLDPEMRIRVDPSVLGFQVPKRMEVPIVREGVQKFLLLFWVMYYLTNSAYLAAGLSIAHRQSPYYLFALSVLGLPLLLLAFVLIAGLFTILVTGS